MSEREGIRVALEFAGDLQRSQTMDVFFAFLTALFYCLWAEFGQKGTMTRARREAGPLLCRIVLSRFGHVWEEWVFVPLILFVLVVPIHFRDFEELDAGRVFIGTVCLCMVITWRPWRRAVMEIRENGIIIGYRSSAPNGPILWNDIECCRWMRGRGKLRIQRRQHRDVVDRRIASNQWMRGLWSLWTQRRPCRDDVECRVASDQVATATAILSQYVEIRSATGGQTIAPPARNPSGTAPIGGCPAPPRLRSERWAKQFGFLAVISAFCWLSVVYQDCLQQKKVLAKFAAYEPEVDWIGFDVYRVDFSKCTNKPSDHDLILLEWLEHLHQLNLEGAPISDAGLKYLHNMKTLQYVTLSDTQVTQKGADDLKQAIPDANILWDSWRK